MLKAICKAPAFHGKSAAHERRIADTASARLWLTEGAPLADVLTMLEVRRRFELSPHDSRTYAVEILAAARAEIDHTHQIQSNRRKEQFHAVA